MKMTKCDLCGEIVRSGQPAYQVNVYWNADSASNDICRSCAESAGIIRSSSEGKKIGAPRLLELLSDAIREAVAEHKLKADR